MPTLELKKDTMGEDGNQDQSEILTQPQVVEVDSQRTESLLKKASRQSWLKKALQVIGISAVVSNPMVPQNNDGITGTALAHDKSSDKSVGYHLDKGMPSQKLFVDNVALVKELSASLTVTDTIKPLQQDRTQIEQEWEEQGWDNHYHVIDTVFIRDQNGEAKKMFTLVDRLDKTSPYRSRIGMVDESHIDPVSKVLTEYKAVTFLEIGIQNPRAVAAGADGTFGLVGGEDPIRGNRAKLVAFFDGWKIPKEIEWPAEFANAGGIVDILSLTGTNSFLINLGNFEGVVSMYIADVDPAAKTVKIRATNISGSSYSLSISSVDTAMSKFKGVASGSFTLQRGIIIYEGDYKAGTVTPNHIDKVKIDGKEVNLPWLYGAALYNKNGEEYVLGSDIDIKRLYNINLKTKEATLTNYAFWLNGRGIPDYMQYSLEIAALRPFVDSEGKVHVWFGGGYTSASGGSGAGRAVAGHFILGTDPMQDPDALTPYYPSQSSFSYIGKERDIKVKKIAGQAALDINITGFGKGLIFLNPDWSPAQGGTIYYLVKGLGSEAKVYKVFTPLVTKDHSGSW